MRNGYFVLVLGNFNLVSGEKSEEHIANQRVHFIGFSISEGENISLVQQICFNGTKLFKKKIFKYSVRNFKSEFNFLLWTHYWSKYVHKLQQHYFMHKTILKPI